MTEVEEEALVPLVRNRKSKPTAPKKAYIPSHVSNIGQTLKSTDSTIKNELVEKPKNRQNLKKIRKFFSTEKDTPSKVYYIIGGEVIEFKISLHLLHNKIIVIKSGQFSESFSVVLAVCYLCFTFLVLSSSFVVSFSG